jgi:hypothetical protein
MTSRNGSVEIVVIDVDGRGEIVISNDSGFDYFPSWSRWPHAVGPLLIPALPAPIAMGAGAG